MDRVQEKLGKYPCLVWVIALIPVLFGGLIYLLYRPKSIILFEVLNKLGASTTVNMVRNKADMFICENVNCSPNIAQILYCQRTF